MTPNWFLAWPIELDETFVIGDPPAGVRVFHPADRHVTAAFLGPCDEEAARRAFEPAGRIAAPVDRGTLGAVEALGKPSRPSALSAIVDEGREALAAVIEGHRDRWLSLAGRPPDRYGALPHCTLARPSRKASDAERRAAVDWGRQLPTIGVGFAVGPLSLYTWAEDRRRRLFRIVDR